DDIRVVEAEINLDIGLGLAPRRRRARIEQQSRIPARNREGLAARMPDRVVERDAGQIAGAAQPVHKGLIDVAALVVQLAARCSTVEPPNDLAISVAADAQRGVGAGDQKRSREAAYSDRRVERTGLRTKPWHERPRRPG